MVAQPEAGGGLANLGNTCFMNSVLQCLVHTQLLHRYLEKRQHSAKCRRRQGEFCLFCALEDLVQRTFAQGPRSPAFAPRAIANALPAIAKGFRLGRQEDAHEFLRYVLEKLTKEGSAVVEAARPPGVTGKYTALQSWFSGALRSQIQCCHCGHESNTQDPFLDLSLELRAVGGRVAPDLDGAMTQFCQEEFLDGANKYKCEACGKLRRARKQFLVERPPRHLSVHLKRFSFGEAGGGSGKISAHVAFPATWQLARYSAARTRLGVEQTPPLPYQLYAVVCHDGGSTHSGHYYCYVRA
ncbi:hypothetical protein EMIHUDRAFT_69418, partial [Emiliania huxleyi CCMP1516]|uniref:ubiquitinyl hydrolase 1 n=2 Tax=Emiliania huxleyi TaxID=2903 RepID=A0A0D3HXN4_EMIH1